MKLALALIVSTLTFASFNGKWSGEGYYFTEKTEGECSEVFFDFFEDQKYFKIKTGGYNCSPLSAEYPFSKFEKKDGKLLYRGEEVGTYTNSKVSLHYYDGIFSLFFEKVDGKINYKEVWQDGSDLMVIQSTLNHL